MRHAPPALEGSGAGPEGRARLLEAALAASPDHLFVMDRLFVTDRPSAGPAFRCRYASPAAARALGLAPGAEVGRTAAELGLLPDLAARLEREWEVALAAGEAVAGTADAADPDGGTRHFEHASAPLPAHWGALACWVRDVTGRTHEERSGRAAVRRLEALIGSLQAGVLVEDDRGQVVLANAAFCALMGLAEPPEALLGANAARLARRCAARFADPHAFGSRLPELRRRQAAASGEALALADGRTLERDYVPVFPGDGSGGHLWLYRDVTERRRAEERQRDYAVVLEFQKGELERAGAAVERANTELARANAELARANAELARANGELATLARTDGLTGLANQRAFREALAGAAARARREGTPLSLVLLDVDHFKAYNDAFGHPSGDALLRDLGALLRGEARAGETAARYGGEEFALLLPGADAEEAWRRAEGLRTAVSGASWERRAVTASLGVGTLHGVGPLPEGGADSPDKDGTSASAADRLLEDADRALYRAKAGGRDRVEAGPEPR